MSVEVVRKVITDFLSRPEPEVLVLTGLWGVGKTHLWNAVLRAEVERVALEKYSYVSLFGVSTMAELRTSIFAKTQAVRLIGKKTDAALVNKEWAALTKGAALQFVQRTTSFLSELPGGRGVSVGLDSIAPHLTRDTIICLDDLERQSTIPTDQILGLVTELKEEKGCKVALIFNSIALKGRDAYALYREKVVDLEVAFEPTPDEAFNLVFLPSDPGGAQVRASAGRLAITNVRLLRRLRRLTSLLLGSAGDVSEIERDRIVDIATFLCWAALDNSDRSPPIERIAEWNEWIWREADPSLGSAERAWANAIVKYGLSAVGRLELAIAKVAQRGYLDGSGFEEQLARSQMRTDG